MTESLRLDRIIMSYTERAVGVQQPRLIVILVLYVLTAPTLLSAQQGLRLPLRLYLDCAPCAEVVANAQIPHAAVVQDRALADIWIRDATGATADGDLVIIAVASAPLGGVADTVRVPRSGLPAFEVSRRMLGALKFLLACVLNRAGRQDVFAVQLVPTKAGEESASRSGWRATASLSGSAALQQRVSNSSFIVGGVASYQGSTARFEIGGNYSYSSAGFAMADGSSMHVTSRALEGRLVIALPIGAFATAGASGRCTASQFTNVRQGLALSPGIEISVGGYPDRLSHDLLVGYSATAQRSEYRDTTIFNVLQETTFSHRLSITGRVVSDWGTANLSLAASHFLHRIQLHNIQVSGMLSLRLAVGVFLNLSLRGALVRDQIGLRRVAATPQMILLQQQEMETAFGLSTNIGLTYTIGTSDFVPLAERFVQMGN